MPKTCPDCGETDVTWFYKNARRSDGLQVYCVSCTKARRMAYDRSPKGIASKRRRNAKPGAIEARKRYAQGAGRAATRKASRKFAKARQAEALELILAAKDAPCADCGGRFPSAAMDFDHVRGPKLENVSRMPYRTHSMDVIKAEIAKCEVVCANCHRIRTFSPELRHAQ